MANDIQVTNVSLVNTDLGQGITHVAFDIGWQNSWRGGGVGNWDAAWVFVKYRLANGVWQHAYVSNTGHTAPSGSQIDLGLLTPGTAYNATTNPVMGVFIRRNADGSGAFQANDARLQWNYGTLGLAFNDIAEVKVFAIEMVYVNQGAFFVGSGGTEIGSFTDGSWVSGATIPRQITSEDALTIGQAAGNLWGTSSSGQSTIGPSGTLPADFPKGFRAFYCMKYEVSQQQYVDFLNTLTYSQQVNRTATAPNSVAGTGALESTNFSRNGIDIQTPGVANSNTPAMYACNLNGNGVYGEADDGKDIACNWLSWGDLTAYLDWSGLRPMTELEFEKACRGPIAPVAGEFPWGTGGVSAFAPYILANSGAINEGIELNYSTTLGNGIAGNTSSEINGPVRVGIFAAHGSNTGRVSAGASYYGIMEMGGNVTERPVTAGNVAGRAFTAIHGNGTLAPGGDHDAATWPAGTTSEGSGVRGGTWFAPTIHMRVSVRVVSSFSDPIRADSFGGRGVRSAP